MRKRSSADIMSLVRAIKKEAFFNEAKVDEVES